MVHTERGSALLSASLWPCLQTPTKGRSTVCHTTTKAMEICSNQIKVPQYPKMVERCVESEEWFDSGKELSASEEVAAEIWGDDSEKELLVVSDL